MEKSAAVAKFGEQWGCDRGGVTGGGVLEADAADLHVLVEGREEEAGK